MLLPARTYVMAITMKRTMMMLMMMLLMMMMVQRTMMMVVTWMMTRIVMVMVMMPAGTCVNVGCVPKKIMFNTATMMEHLEEVRVNDDLG
jgi:hypothetical protein